MRLTRQLLLLLTLLLLVAGPASLAVPHPIALWRSFQAKYIDDYDGCRCAQCASIYFGYQERDVDRGIRALLALTSWTSAGVCVVMLALARRPLGLFRGKRWGEGQCRRCGYHLDGLEPRAVCPECGQNPGTVEPKTV